MLFEKKKKNEAKCSCGSVSSACSVCCGEKVSGICCIKVLGLGCQSCHTFFENTKQAVSSAGLEIEVEYVTDLQKIAEYGVMTMPALVVNEKVVSAGKVLKPAEIEKLLRNFA